MPDNDDRMPAEVLRAVAVLVASVTMIGRPQNTPNIISPVEDLLMRSKQIERYIQNG